ncbi:hypothetical protein ZWY2020_010928 [Hordeum vulgare]|nr:hypothetical protein ZWY2020_010928 [Hordeum vulgare]
MPKRTMGDRADAMVYEASKPHAKVHMDEPIPTGEELSGQQGGLDVFDDVQALPPEQVTPLRPLLPPLPQPVVDGDDDGEEPYFDNYADISEDEMDAHTQKTLEELQNGQFLSV